MLSSANLATSGGLLGLKHGQKQPGKKGLQTVNLLIQLKVISLVDWQNGMSNCTHIVKRSVTIN